MSVLNFVNGFLYKNTCTCTGVMWCKFGAVLPGYRMHVLPVCGFLDVKPSTSLQEVWSCYLWVLLHSTHQGTVLCCAVPASYAYCCIQNSFYISKPRWAGHV